MDKAIPFLIKDRIPSSHNQLFIHHKVKITIEEGMY